MPIEHEQVTEVYGTYFNGEIRRSKYKYSGSLINTNKRELTSKQIRKIMAEMEELAQLIEAHETIDKLSPKENDIHEVDIDEDDWGSLESEDIF